MKLINERHKYSFGTTGTTRPPPSTHYSVHPPSFGDNQKLTCWVLGEQDLIREMKEQISCLDRLEPDSILATLPDKTYLHLSSERKDLFAPIFDPQITVC